jgi:hypothetical protein
MKGLVKKILKKIRIFEKTERFEELSLKNF